MYIIEPIFWKLEFTLRLYFNKIFFSYICQSFSALTLFISIWLIVIYFLSSIIQLLLHAFSIFTNAPHCPWFFSSSLVIYFFLRLVLERSLVFFHPSIHFFISSLYYSITSLYIGESVAKWVTIFQQKNFSFLITIKIFRPL